MMPAFIIAVVLISSSPGPAFALIVRRAAVRGFRASVPTVFGLELGIYLWALLAAAGVGALVAASELAYLVLRVAGAVVLVYLGVQALRSARQDRTDSPEPASGMTRPSGGWRGFGEGLAVQLANPKAAVFMIAFYPQFVPRGYPLFATTAWLALLQVALESVFYLSLAAGVARAGGWFTRRKVRRGLAAACGGVLIGLGIRVAVTAR